MILFAHACRKIDFLNGRIVSVLIEKKPEEGGVSKTGWHTSKKDLISGTRPLHRAPGTSRCNVMTPPARVRREAILTTPYSPHPTPRPHHPLPCPLSPVTLTHSILTPAFLHGQLTEGGIDVME